ncbi:ATP-grasp domain-containing protein [Candidatus Nitrosopumilus salaria]|nr:ATP-grasp domain-containing protein [Candidatus Nitrosopumilus salaria]
MFLNQEDVGKMRISFATDPELICIIRLPNKTIDLRSVTATYYRPYDWREFSQFSSSSSSDQNWQLAQINESILNIWTELTDSLVINKPSMMGNNNSKPLQSEIIKSIGFRTPETLITTNPNTVKSFHKKHKTVIYKSISGVRSIVSKLNTEKLSELNDVQWCPTQFQEYVKGIDYRIHVIGDSIFPCKILSHADDYRYSSKTGRTTRLVKSTIPLDVQQKCIKLTKKLGLLISGIDLRQNPNGDWYCFEVNPTPGYTFYQEQTGQPIGQKIADLLSL